MQWPVTLTTNRESQTQCGVVVKIDLQTLPILHTLSSSHLLPGYCVCESVLGDGIFGKSVGLL